MGNERKTEHCVICGSPVESLPQADALVCIYCGASEQGQARCPKGHYVCEACHGRHAMQMIKSTVFSTALRSPHEIAELMMRHPGLPMLGCEHAFVAAGAFMAALKNSPYGRGTITNGEIHEVFTRTAKQAVSGYCGMTGVCGIVPAVGACFSLFLGSRCGADNEQRITMEAGIRIFQAIAGLTGPSCCKAYVRSALTETVALFGERFGIVFEQPEGAVVCRHIDKHPHGCRESRCPYYEKPSRDIFAEPIHLKAASCQS